MPRIARIAIEGIPYHITQRGNGRQQIFFCDADYQLYLDLLVRSAAQARLRLHAYCCMPNHTHLIATPERPDSMPKALSRTHADFARHFNLQGRASGHVWQARYFSCPLDRRHFWQATAYVERNPVRAGLALRAEDFRWSSAAARLGKTPVPGFLDFSLWRDNFTTEEWASLLESHPEEIDLGERLADAGIRGRPLGDEKFLTSLESRAERRLRAKPVGRPKQIIANDEAQTGLGIGI
ncbi:MAG TPA: transposase [Bryobacteraceae bacterium]|jgi:putative transposase|nr:transposase [Bryobacteraceae bacterium]